MAQTIKLKRSATSGAVPTTASLALGEMAINTHDGKAYIKKDNGTESVVEIGAGETYSAGTGISLSGTTFSLTDTNAKLNLSGGTLTGGLTGTTAQFANVGIGASPNAHGLYVYHTDNFEAVKFQTNQGGSLARFTDTTASIEIGVQSGKPVIRTGNTARLTVDGANVDINSGALKMAGTTVIDSSRNLTNIGTINSGAITSTSSMNATGGYYVSGTAVVDASRNLTNIGTITATGGNSTNWNTAYGWGNHASAGYTSNVGDITGVIGGTGLTGGGYSGTVTLNVIGGSGITANANDIAVDSTVIRTTGTQSISGQKDFSSNLGLGTSAPERKLHIFNGESGALASNANSALVIEDDSNAYISFLTPNFLEAGLLFGDSADNDAGSLTYNHLINRMSIRAGGTSVLSIESTGIDVTGNTLSDSLTASGSLNGLNAGSVMLDYNGSSVSRLLAVGANATTTGTLKVVSTASDGGPYIEALTVSATGIDVTGTATMDGLTVSASQAGGVTAQIQNSNSTQTGGSRLDFLYSGSTVTGRIQNRFNGSDFQTDWYAGNHGLEIFTDLAKTEKRLDIAHNGDISFYEDTGTTAKFFWDASAESLGIGTDSPASVLDVSGEAPTLTLRDSRTGGSWTAGTALGKLDFYTSDATGIGAHSIASIGVVAGGSSTASPDGELVFATGSYNAVSQERLRIDSSGNVGIGTSSPIGKLDVSDGSNPLSIDSSTYNEIQSYNRPLLLNRQGNNVGIGTSSPLQALHVNSGTGNSAAIFESTDSTSQIWLKDSASSTTYQTGLGCLGDNLLFNNGGERMRIDSSGRVGIGTSSPDGILDIEGNFESQKALVLTNTQGTGKVSYLRSHGLNGESLSLYHDGNRMQSWESDGSIKFEGSGSERMRIDSSGNVGIGVTNPNTLLTLKAEGSNVPQYSGYTTGGTHIYSMGRDGSNGLGLSAYGTISFRTGATTGFTSGSERMRIDSSGRVGIGKTASGYKLDIEAATGGNGFKLTRGAGTQFNIFQSADGVSHVGSSGSNAALVFRTGTTVGADTERMRIDTSGNLLVGKTYTATGNVGQELRAGGYTAFTRSGGNPLELKRLASDGSLINFYKDGTTVGSIGAISGDLAIYSSVSGHNGLRLALGAVLPTSNTGVVADNSADLGSASYRFKDLYLSGNIHADAQIFATGIGHKSDTNTFISFPQSDRIVFTTGNSEAARFDASGNLLVGTTSTSASVAGGRIFSTGRLVTSVNDEGHYFRRNSSDGSLIDFAKDGTTVGSIRSISGDSIGIGNGDAGLRFVSSTNRIQPVDMDNGLNSDGLTSLGDTNKRFKDLYLSGDVRAGGRVYVEGSTTNYLAQGPYTSTNLAINCGSATFFYSGSTQMAYLSTTTAQFNNQIIADKSAATTSDAAATIISKGTVDTTTGYQPQNWHITFQDGGGTVRGKITSSHYSTQYSTSSDYRLKEDIQPIANATERLLAINAVNFKWIDGQQRSDGFIAHELQEHLPEAVTGEKDATTEVTETVVADDGTETEVTTTVPEMQGIDQSKLVPLLVKTIQELEARITALENA